MTGWRSPLGTRSHWGQGPAVVEGLQGQSCRRDWGPGVRTAVPCDSGHVSQQSTQSACVLHSETPGPPGRLRVAHHILPRVLSNPGARHSMDVFPSQCTFNKTDSDLHTLPAKLLSQEREKLAGNISVLQQGNLQRAALDRPKATEEILLSLLFQEHKPSN